MRKENFIRALEAKFSCGQIDRRQFVIECPLHQGRFDIPSGRALSAPVCEDLKTYAVKVEAGDVFIAVEQITGLAVGSGQ